SPLGHIAQGSVEQPALGGVHDPTDRHFEPRMIAARTSHSRHRLRHRGPGRLSPDPTQKALQIIGMDEVAHSHPEPLAAIVPQYAFAARAEVPASPFLIVERQHIRRMLHRELTQRVAPRCSLLWSSRDLAPESE